MYKGELLFLASRGIFAVSNKKFNFAKDMTIQKDHCFVMFALNSRDISWILFFSNMAC